MSMHSDHANPVSIGSKMTGLRRLSSTWALSFFWLMAAGVGLKLLNEYDNSAGSTGNPPERWPNESRGLRASDRPIFLMFPPPRCACSRASLEELDRLMAQAEGRFVVHLLFEKRPGAAPDWAN